MMSQKRDFFGGIPGWKVKYGEAVPSQINFLIFLSVFLPLPVFLC